MNWLKRKLRVWLGVDQLSKKTTDLWWDIHDGAGLKAKLEQQERIVALLSEMSAHPEVFSWGKGLTWKSPHWKTSKKTWKVHCNGEPYEAVKLMSNSTTRETKYD